MSSSLLNKNHPFRKSISHDSPSEATTAANGPLASNIGVQPVEDEEQGISLKTKLRIALGVSVFCGLWFVMANFEQLFLGTDSGNSALAAEERELTRSSKEVNDDWAYQGSAAEEHVGSREVGFFASIFCRGAKRSAFCD